MHTHTRTQQASQASSATAASLSHSLPHPCAPSVQPSKLLCLIMCQGRKLTLIGFNQLWQVHTATTTTTTITAATATACRLHCVYVLVTFLTGIPQAIRKFIFPRKNLWKNQHIFIKNIIAFFMELKMHFFR